MEPLIIALLTALDWLLDRLTGGIWSFLEGEEKASYHTKGKQA